MPDSFTSTPTEPLTVLQLYGGPIDSPITP